MFVKTSRTELAGQAITYYFSAQVDDPAGT